MPPGALLLAGERAYIPASFPRGRNVSIDPDRRHHGIVHSVFSPPQSGRRAGPSCPVLARRAAAVLCADRAAGAAGRRQRLRRQGGAEPQSAAGRPDLPPLLRRTGPAARADAALAGLRCHRRCLRPRRHQRPRHRGRGPGESIAVGQAGIRGRDPAEGSAHRSRRAAPEGHQGKVSDPGPSPIPTSCWLATSCSRSAIPSASARP
ncbi:hypothetical protein ACVWXQ_002745 [Bradyrhizobium sp. S3.14.4]